MLKTVGLSRCRFSMIFLNVIHSLRRSAMHFLTAFHVVYKRIMMFVAWAVGFIRKLQATTSRLRAGCRYHNRFYLLRRPRICTQGLRTVHGNTRYILVHQNGTE